MAMSLPLLRHCSRCWNYSFANIQCRHLAISIRESVKPRSREVITVEEDVEYPPIKPKYPPGQWGEMEHTYAWLWQKAKDDLLDIPDVQGRLDYLNTSEMNCINAIPFNDHPDYLKFAAYVTKSCVFPWVQEKPPIYSEIESEVNKSGILEKVKQILMDQISMESEMIVRNDRYSKERIFSKLVFRCIADTLITNLSDTCKHLQTSAYDEDVIVRTLWDRHGIQRQRSVKTGKTSFIIKPVLDHRIVSSCNFTGMLRSDIPLPQLVERESGLSVEREPPVLDYKYFTYGVSKNRQFKLKSLLAGHILGDPCEYGLIGFVSTSDKSDALDEQYGLQVAQNCRLGRGLLMTFSWLAAQAYNQGFSGLVDLSYPLTSQTVMSDGRKFSFLSYQLNTLELWKCNAANRMVNLCWHTQEMPLYDCIEDGQVKGFNDDTLKMLVTMFLLKPSARGYDMKPTITEKDGSVHLRDDFIPYKQEVVEKEEEEEQFIV